MRKYENGLWKFPDDYNHIKEYHKAIESGEVIANHKITQIMKYLSEQVDVNDTYYYDHKRAIHPITFIENFITHYKGSNAGKPFFLELWQRAIISAFFGFIHSETGLRKYRELLLMVSRKQGKSALASAIAVYMQFAEGENAPSLVSVATKREQAKLVFDVSKRFINGSKHLSKNANVLLNEIRTDFNDGSFKPLASESNSLDGLDINFAVHDELHAYKDANLYNVVVDGMSARKQPVTLITTTNGFVRNGIFDLKYEEAKRIIDGLFVEDGYKDDTILPFVYELDDINEWKEEKNWEKANPGIGTIKDRDALATKVYQAKHNPLLVNNLLTKDFNVASSREQAWLNFNDYNIESTFDFEQIKPSYAIAGLDLSKTTDLTSANIFFKLPNDETLYFEHMYFMPANVLDKRIEEDKVPYDVWVQQGYLRLSEGGIVKEQDVLDWFDELRAKHDIYVVYLGYDEWGFSSLLKDEFAGRIGADNLFNIRQGAKTLSIPMYRLEAELKSKNVNYNNNPITKWCISNTHVQMDSNGNIKPTKSRQGKRQRIDGLASMLNSYTLYLDKQNDYDNLV
ncbi:terminase large subunit [Savagea sp. SN6]|uniref:Terminase large subunit n=1 Tax=Savagea serpentis TaxID=2785297 RepID=A0A8J7KBB1_9BACL|nr:terminase TerL endonuclease subunit [Savagea serpentis]MBF4500227.1 terminase large subunit [Savagea serpentis]